MWWTCVPMRLPKDYLKFKSASRAAGSTATPLLAIVREQSANSIHDQLARPSGRNCRRNSRQTFHIAFLHAIGSQSIPESVLTAYLYQFWSSAVFNWCRAIYVMQWKWPPNLLYCIFASYWEPNYTREWTRSLFRPFLGHGGRLPFSTGVARFTYYFIRPSLFYKKSNHLFLVFKIHFRRI